MSSSPSLATFDANLEADDDEMGESLIPVDGVQWDDQKWDDGTDEWE